MTRSEYEILEAKVFADAYLHWLSCMSFSTYGKEEAESRAMHCVRKFRDHYAHLVVENSGE